MDRGQQGCFSENIEMLVLIYFLLICEIGASVIGEGEKGEKIVENPPEIKQDDDGKVDPPAVQEIVPIKEDKALSIWRQDYEADLEKLVASTFKELMLNVDDRLAKRLVNDPKKLAQLQRDVHKHRHLAEGTGFDQQAFDELVRSKEPCGEIQIAAYHLWGGSTKYGVYHVGLYVCQIEIHYHRPGVEFWKPKDYHTLFKGGHFKRHEPLKYWKSKQVVRTDWNFQQIVDLVEKKYKEKYTKKNYNMFLHNCLDFAKELVKEIAVKHEGDRIKWPYSVIFPVLKPFEMIRRTTNSGQKALGKSVSATTRSMSKSFSKSFGSKYRSMSLTSLGRILSFGQGSDGKLALEKAIDGAKPLETIEEDGNSNEVDVDGNH